MEIALAFSSGRHEARVSDLSLGGCFVDSILDVSEGEKADFSLHLPTGQWLRLSGEVVYKFPQIGFGISFIDLTEEQRSLLKDAIRSHGEDPDEQAD